MAPTGSHSAGSGGCCASRGLFDRNRTFWAGFVLRIGAYEPRWLMRDVHLNPVEAVQAHLDLGSRRTLGMHFGTFQLTTEAIDEPLRALRVARTERAVSSEAFRAPEFGETIVVR